jgi:hypothetical protein
MYLRRLPSKAIKGKIGKLYFYAAGYRLAGGGYEISGRVKFK